VQHAASLGLVLGGLWLLLSGYVDREWHPLHLLVTRFLLYLPWILKEIVKANLHVTRLILDPKLPISPTVTRLRCSQRTDGKVTYANSITLTPGTVTIDMEGDVLVVHTLTREAAAALQEGEMDRRVGVLEKA
jgi:multicomponent Na+:H+ antiporter subunit E